MISHSFSPPEGTRSLRTFIKRGWLGVVLLFLLSACKDDISRSNVPEVKFSVQIPLITFPRLNTQGESLLLNRRDARFPLSLLGYGGIIVTHSIFEEYTFFCYDRSCPNDLTQTSLPVNFIVSCSQCGTKYNILNYGFPENVSDKKQQPLKRYLHVFYDDYTGKIQIAN